MAFWNRIFKTRQHAATQNEEKSTLRPILSRITPGQAVATPRRYDALAAEGYRDNVIAYRAINLLARAIASVPMRLYCGDVRLDEHELLTLLSRPNPRVSGENFFYNLAGYYLIAGNAYALSVGPDGGAPKELWLMRPDSMSVLAGEDGLPRGFEQNVGGKKQRFAADSVLHWKSFNPLSDWYGLAPLEAAALAVDSYNEGTRWNLALIQNGGTPSGVLYQEGADAPLTDAQFKSLKEQVEARHTGPANAGRPLLLEGGLKWQDMGLSPKDMDWTAAKNMTAREIAMAFGVPPQMLGVPDAQTYSNYSEARASLWEDTEMPLAGDIAQELTNWLVPKYAKEGGSGLKLVPDFDEVPALAEKRAARFSRIANAAFLTDPEKRKILGFGKRKTS